jgi:hypothetical protein
VNLLPDGRSTYRAIVWQFFVAGHVLEGGPMMRFEQIAALFPKAGISGTSHLLSKRQFIASLTW